MFAASLPDLDRLHLEAAKGVADRAAQELHGDSELSVDRERTPVVLVEKLQRMLVGTKSEKVLRQIEQLELQLEELQAANAVVDRAAARVGRSVRGNPAFPATATGASPSPIHRTLISDTTHAQGRS